MKFSRFAVQSAGKGRRSAERISPTPEPGPTKGGSRTSERWNPLLDKTHPIPHLLLNTIPRQWHEITSIHIRVVSESNSMTDLTQVDLLLSKFSHLMSSAYTRDSKRGNWLHELRVPHRVQKRIRLSKSRGIFMLRLVSPRIWVDSSWIPIYFTWTILVHRLQLSTWWIWKFVLRLQLLQDSLWRSSIRVQNGIWRSNFSVIARQKIVWELSWVQSTFRVEFWGCTSWMTILNNCCMIRRRLIMVM